MRRLLFLGLGVLLVTLAVQKDWLRINWYRIQDDLGIHQVIDPQTNRLRPMP